MNILKALGIMAVVGQHCGVRVLAWFPATSFAIPMFFFISGYFFHDAKFLAFLKSKWTHLARPLLLWNLAFGLLCTVLLHYGFIRFGKPLSLETFFVQPFTNGSQFQFNLANWFVGTLVEVQLVYWTLYRVCKKNHIALLLVSLAFYWVAWGMAMMNLHKTYGEFMLATEKVMYFLIYFELGFLYRLYIEKKDSFSVNRVVGLAVLNGFFLAFVNKNIAQANVMGMGVIQPVWLPLAVALSGIYLYLQVAELLKDKVKRDSLLGFIGEHTFSIMALHMFFFWLLNIGFLLLNKYGFLSLRSFNQAKFVRSFWFKITEFAPLINGIYFLVGMGGSLLCVYLYERYKPVLWERIRAWRA